MLLSNVLWTLYSLKAQAWFDRASQLHRAYVASLSAMGWLILTSLALIALGLARSPFGVSDGWVWTQLLMTAVLASGLGGYCWNIGASRLGVAVASLWVNLVPFFAVLLSVAYGFVPNVYQIVGGLVALSGVVHAVAKTGDDRRMTDTLKARNCRMITVPAPPTRAPDQLYRVGQGAGPRGCSGCTTAPGQWRAGTDIVSRNS